MKTIKEYFLAAIVSLEFLILIVGSTLYFIQDWVQLISSRLSDTPEILQHVSLLPFAMAVWTFNENKKLLFPDEEDKEDIALQKWPDYWKLRIYFNVSLMYAVAFTAVGIYVWILGYKITDPKGFILLVVSVIGAFVVAGSTYFARIQQKEILLNNKI